MSAGPILIFDKSLLEALSPDEAVWLGQFYRVNVIPIFLVETLADLEKEIRDGRTPEQVVGRLAEKTSVMSADPNVYHATLAVGDLLGNHVEMHRLVVRGPGRSVLKEGKKGIIFDVSDEARALERWRRRRFLEVEHQHARAWRQSLESLGLEDTYRRFKAVARSHDRPRTLRDVKDLVDRLVNDPALAEQMIGTALDLLSVPYEWWPEIFARWQAAGRPTLPRFAPYATHVLTVEFFFGIALGVDLISKDRASNKIDLAYLYYLPFCMVFASMDKLHARTAPLFLRDDQQFLWGADVKADLGRLDEHYSKLPEETRRRGVMSFAHRPPLDGDFLVTQLWDRFLSPIWRAPRTPRTTSTDEAVKKLTREFREAKSAPAGSTDLKVSQADFVILEQSVPRRFGKWNLVPPETPGEPGGGA